MRWFAKIRALSSSLRLSYVLMGIKMQAHPTKTQKVILSQWMGCARVIWNAKCEEEKYLNSFARKYLPVGTYAPIDQTYSQYKNEELTPSAVNRSEKNNIGYLAIKKHRKYQEPNSIYIKKRNGRFTVSFCYEDSITPSSNTDKDNLRYLQEAPRQYLEKHTVGIDRGVAIPVQVDEASYDFTPEQTKSKAVRAGRAVFKVSAYQTSQECADCGNTHPDNRKSQS